MQAHWPKVSGTFKQSLLPFAEELLKRTDGRFKLQFLGAGEIAKGAEVFNIVKRGIVPMGTTSPAYNLQENELMALYAGIPGTAQAPWQMSYYLKTMGMEAAANELLQKSGVMMMAEDSYPTELMVNTKIDADTDVSQLKIRSAGTLIEFFAMAGFATQQIDGPELYQAMATGVVDGAHWGGAIGALSMKLWEVAKFYMKPAIQIGTNCFILNLDAYNKLPADLRTILYELMGEHYYRRTVDYQYEEAEATRIGVEKMGVQIVNYPADVLKRFGEASSKLLATEMAKGEAARHWGEQLQQMLATVRFSEQS